MIRLMLVLALAVFGLFVLALPSPAAATSHWTPLLGCPDVDGDGQVLVGDIVAVVGSYFVDYPSDEYLFLHDMNADGKVRIDDIQSVVSRYFEACPLVDTQVAQATQAVLQYRDQNVAVADGYFQGTQNIMGHGVHYINWALVGDGVFDPTRPEGLNYSLDGKLLALYWIDPLWMPGHEQPPAGFDGDEEMWHEHPQLCAWQGADGPMVDVNVPQADCLSRTGGIWFESFGWMVHLWSFLPNEYGRFEMHNPDAG